MIFTRKDLPKRKKEEKISIYNEKQTLFDVESIKLNDPLRIFCSQNKSIMCGPFSAGNVKEFEIRFFSVELEKAINLRKKGQKRIIFSERLIHAL